VRSESNIINLPYEKPSLLKQKHSVDRFMPTSINIDYHNLTLILVTVYLFLILKIKISWTEIKVNLCVDENEYAMTIVSVII